MVHLDSDKVHVSALPHIFLHGDLPVALTQMLYDEDMSLLPSALGEVAPVVVGPGNSFAQGYAGIDENLPHSHHLHRLEDQVHLHFDGGVVCPHYLFHSVLHGYCYRAGSYEDGKSRYHLIPNDG